MLQCGVKADKGIRRKACASDGKVARIWQLWLFIQVLISDKLHGALRAIR